MSDTDGRADRIEELESEIDSLNARLSQAKQDLLELQCEGAPRSGIAGTASKATACG